VTKLSAGTLISSPDEKTNFRGLGRLEGQNCIGQGLNPFCTDFNTGKNQWVTLRKFGEKKMFSPQSMTKLEDLTVHVVLVSKVSK
jgi:hypothetical protein